MLVLKKKELVVDKLAFRNYDGILFVYFTWNSDAMKNNSDTSSNKIKFFLDKR